MEALSPGGGRSVEPFERAAGAGAQLLRADRLAPASDDEPTRAAAFLLTFDVGRVLVSAEPGAGALVATVIPDPDAAPSGLLDSSEEEPWWRLLGAPLLRARTDDAGGRVSLQFRTSGGGLRTLALAADGARVVVGLVHDA